MEGLETRSNRDELLGVRGEGIYRTMPSVVFAGDQGFLQVEFSRDGLEKIVVEVLHQADDFAAVEQFLEQRESEH